MKIHTRIHNLLIHEYTIHDFLVLELSSGTNYTVPCEFDREKKRKWHSVEYAGHRLSR